MLRPDCLAVQKGASFLFWQNTAVFLVSDVSARREVESQGPLVAGGEEIMDFGEVVCIVFEVFGGHRLRGFDLVLAS